jgi:hypothetical protein
MAGDNAPGQDQMRRAGPFVVSGNRDTAIAGVKVTKVSEQSGGGLLGHPCKSKSEKDEERKKLPLLLFSQPPQVDEGTFLRRLSCVINTRTLCDFLAPIPTRRSSPPAVETHLLSPSTPHKREAPHSPQHNYRKAINNAKNQPLPPRRSTIATSAHAFRSHSLSLSLPPPPRPPSPLARTPGFGGASVAHDGELRRVCGCAAKNSERVQPRGRGLCWGALSCVQLCMCRVYTCVGVCEQLCVSCTAVCVQLCMKTAVK